MELAWRYLHGVGVEYRDLAFGGGMWDIRLSFAKIPRILGYEPKISVEEGICEVTDTIVNGLIKEPLHGR